MSYARLRVAVVNPDAPAGAFDDRLRLRVGHHFANGRMNGICHHVSRFQRHCQKFGF